MQAVAAHAGAPEDEGGGAAEKGFVGDTGELGLCVFTAEAGEGGRGFGPGGGGEGEVGCDESVVGGVASRSGGFEEGGGGVEC